MSCVGCRRQTQSCVVCPATSECPTPVCGPCARDEQRLTEQLQRIHAHDGSEPRHSSAVFEPPGQHDGDAERFDVECDLCGWIAALDSREEAEAIARLHEQFVAVLVDRWEVPS